MPYNNSSVEAEARLVAAAGRVCIPRGIGASSHGTMDARVGEAGFSGKADVPACARVCVCVCVCVCACVHAYGNTVPGSGLKNCMTSGSAMSASCRISVALY